MCEPATIGLIISAVSGGASAVNQNQAFRRQDRAAAEGIRKQGKIQSKTDQSVNAQIKDIQDSAGAKERADSLEGFLNAIRDSKDAVEGTVDPIAAANPRFAERVSGVKANTARLGTEQAGRLSRIDAPLLQRQAEGDRIGRTVGDVNEFVRQATAEDFLTRLRVASQRPNEFVEALAGVGKGVGSALTLGGSGGFFSKLFGGGTKKVVTSPAIFAGP